MPTQRRSAALDSQQANLTENVHPKGFYAHDQAVPVQPSAIRKVSSPAAAHAGTARRKTQSPPKMARESPSPAASSKPTSTKHDREAALEILRLQERAQLERLKQVTQQRRNQRLLEEQLQAEALYNSSTASLAATAVVTSHTDKAAGSPPPSKQVSPKKRQRSPSPAVKARLAASSPSAAAADKAASCKPLGRSSVKMHQLLNPVQVLPSFNSVKHSQGASKVASNTAPASTAAAAAAATASDAHSEGGAATAAGAARSSIIKDMAEATDLHSYSAGTDQAGNEQRRTQSHLSPGDPLGSLQSAAVKKAAVYDKPWRQNMAKKPRTAAGQQLHPAAASAADAAGASSAAALLMAAAADAAKPVALRSKKRTPEQQAKLQAFMAAKYQEHLQLELEEKKRFEAAAARRQVIKQLAAQQREAARQRQLQHPNRHADTFRPERSWRGVLTPSSEGSRESVVDMARQNQQQQHQGPPPPQLQQQKQHREQQLAWQQQQQRQEQQMLELTRQEQMQQQLHKLQFQWQQQQQEQLQQQQGSASSHPIASHAVQQTDVAAAQQPVSQQQVVQQEQAGNATWWQQQRQHKQKLHCFADQHDTLSSRSAAHYLQSSLAAETQAGSHQQQQHNSKSPEHGPKGGKVKLESCHNNNKDVSPSKEYLQDRQAMLAANAMAKRQFDQRLRANHSAATAAVAPAATGYLSAMLPGSNVSGANPAAAIAAAGVGVPCMPETATRLLATALPAGDGSRGSASSRKACRTAGSCRKARSRTQLAATAAGNDHVKQQRRRRLLQQRRAQNGAYDYAFQPESSDEYEVLSESGSEGSADRNPSRVRDQQPLGAVAAFAAATDAAQRDAPMTALAHFWVQQHAADRKHASKSAMIQQLLLQSTMLKQRIEHICNQALKQRQHKLQQQREQEQLRQQQQRQHMRAVRVSLVVAAPEIEPQASDLMHSQQLADKLTVLLRQEHTDGAPAAVTTSGSSKQLQQQQLHQPQPGILPSNADSTTSSGGRGAGEGCSTAVVAAADKIDHLSAQGSRAWQEQLRAQLLEEDAEPDMRAGTVYSGGIPHHQGAAPAAHVDAATAENPLLQPSKHKSGTAYAAELVGKTELQVPGHGMACASNWACDIHSSCLIDAQEATPDFKNQTEYDAAAYSGSSSASSGFADHAGVGRGVHDSRQQLPFSGAFSHLETAVKEAAEAAGDSPDMQYNAVFDCNLPGPTNAAGTAGDHVVTWYSAVGGSLDFGSPEPPSPKHEDSLSAHQMMQAASQAAAASIAAAEPDRPFMAMSQDWDEHISRATDIAVAAAVAVQQEQVTQAEASQVISEACNTSSSYSTSHVQHGRKLWARCTAQEQQEQPQQLRVAAAAAAPQDNGDDMPAGVLPRWFGRPSWAAAGLGGYRWDTLSISSSSDSEASSPSAGVPCEHIVQQHEDLQQQQQLACIPRHGKALALDPRHEAEQAILALRNLENGSEDENQQQLPFEKPAKGDPYSVINIFMRQHRERIERQKHKQQCQEQQLTEKQPQERLQLQQQRDQELQLQLAVEEQPQQQSVAEGAVADVRQLTSQMLELLNQQHPAQHQRRAETQQQETEASQQQQVQHAVDNSEARAVSPSDVHARLAAGKARQQSLPQCSLQLESEQQPDALQQQDWLEDYTTRSAAQQWLLDMDAAGVSSPEQWQQQRRRLSPDTLQRMHEEGLAKLETAQETELDLLLLQQAHERVTLQQEAARVARELDQQQLFALLQQPQHTAAQEQAENSAGLFQRVTKDLLAETVSQLKDVSAVFAQQMRDASRRSCGVQASEALHEPQNAAVQAVQLPSPQHEQQAQDQQLCKTSSYAAWPQAGLVAEEEIPHCSRDRFNSVQEQTAASVSADWSAVLPADQTHPALHFQALLMAERVTAEHTTVAATLPDCSSALKVSDAVGTAAGGQQASSCHDSRALDASDSETREQPLDVSAVPSSGCVISDAIPEELSVHPAAERSAASVYEISQNGGAAVTFSQIVGAPNAVGAAAEAVSASQQYGSSSFESCGEVSSMQQQTPRTVIEQQLTEAKQQLDALSRHMDAIMIGYAVQAMQASGDKLKQAAIHQQALKEQQETANEKQHLVVKVLRLQQQLGLRSSLSDSDTASADSNQATQATAVALLAQAAVATAAAGASPSRPPASTAPRKQWQNPTSTAATTTSQEGQQQVGEEPFAAGVHGCSASPASSVTEGSNLEADRDGESSRSASEVASLGGAYSEDFEAAEATVVHSNGLAATEVATAELGVSTRGSLVLTGVGEQVPAPADSADSLEVTQQQVIALQQKVAREYEENRLDQQQTALQQLLQQLTEQPIPGGTDSDWLLAAAGIQVTAGSAPASVHRDVVAPAVVVVSVPAAQRSAEAVVAAYCDDFVAEAADEHVDISRNTQPQQNDLPSPVAHALTSASSIASSASSVADGYNQHWSLTASQLSGEFSGASEVHVESPQAARAVADFEQAESAAHPAAAAESSATESQGYTDDGFCSILSAASPPLMAATSSAISAAALLGNAGSATTAAAERTLVASVLDTATESMDAASGYPAAAAGASAPVAEAPPAPHGPVEVYSYELSASKVGTELLDDQSVELELCASEQEYTATACDEQHVAPPGEEALGELQQEQLLAQSECEQQQYTMDFASSVTAEAAGDFMTSNWAVVDPQSGGTAADSTPAVKPADQTAQAYAADITPVSSAESDSSATARKGWMIETAASSSIPSMPVPSSLPPAELQLGQQFRKQLDATGAEALLQHLHSQQDPSALSPTIDGQGIQQEGQEALQVTHHGKDMVAVAAIGDQQLPRQRPQEALVLQQSVGSSAAESLAQSTAEEESIPAAEGIADTGSEVFVSGALCELEAYLEQQQAKQQAYAVAVTSQGLTNETAFAELRHAEQPVLAAARVGEPPTTLNSLTGTAAAQAVEEALATEAAPPIFEASGGQHSSSINRAMMCSSTTSFQGEGGYITMGHGGSGRITADSIDLEYSDWTVGQQDFRRFSYDFATDAVPARLSAQQPAAEESTVSPAVQAAAATATAAAAVVSTTTKAKPMDDRMLSDGVTDATCSDPQHLSRVAASAAEISASEAERLADSCAAIHVPRVAMTEALENNAVQAVADESCAYSMDFSSMLLQQSSLTSVAEDPASAAIPAAASMAADAAATSQHVTVAQETETLVAAEERVAVCPANKEYKFEPLAGKLECKQHSWDHEHTVQLSQQEEQQSNSNDLAEAICTATLDKMLEDVLSEAVHMWGSNKVHHDQQAAPDALHAPHQQKHAERAGGSSASANSAESADTSDTADSSAGSKSIQPDWLSSPGSPPAHLSPLSMRAAAAASTVSLGGSIVNAVSSTSSLAGAVHCSSGLVSHPPTDWTPMSDDLTTPWLGEASASSRCGEPTLQTATTDEDVLGLAVAARQLDPLLQAAADSDVIAERQAEAQLLHSSDGELGAPGGCGPAELTVSSTEAQSSSAAPAAAASIVVDGEADLVLPSARDTSGADDEFDWPDTEQALAASSSGTAAVTAAAPMQRRTPSPPPVIVDDSPAHTIEYVLSVLDTQAGPPINFPPVLALGEEALGLDRYLWLEKDGRPDMSQLADGSDSDDRHIHHKALYDATNQAIMQLYAAANRVQVHPICEAAGPARLMRPLPSQQQLAAEISSKVAGWAKMRVRDEVGLDKLLAEDALEDEKMWVNRQAEVAEIALEVERGILEDLLADAAAVMAGL